MKKTKKHQNYEKQIKTFKKNQKSMKNAKPIVKKHETNQNYSFATKILEIPDSHVLTWMKFWHSNNITLKKTFFHHNAETSVDHSVGWPELLEVEVVFDELLELPVESEEELESSVESDGILFFGWALPLPLLCFLAFGFAFGFEETFFLLSGCPESSVSPFSLAALSSSASVWTTSGFSDALMTWESNTASSGQVLISNGMAMCKRCRVYCRALLDQNFNKRVTSSFFLLCGRANIERLLASSGTALCMKRARGLQQNLGASSFESKAKSSPGIIGSANTMKWILDDALRFSRNIHWIFGIFATLFKSGGKTCVAFWRRALVLPGGSIHRGQCAGCRCLMLVLAWQIHCFWFTFKQTN